MQHDCRIRIGRTIRRWCWFGLTCNSGLGSACGTVGRACASSGPSPGGPHAGATSARAGGPGRTVAEASA